MNPNLPKTAPIAHDTEEIERILNTQFHCKVQDWGYGHHKAGYHSIGIIVGKKDNPGYDPGSAYKEIRNAPKEVPDVRGMHIPGDADENWLINQAQNIKKTLPDNQNLEFKSDVLEKLQKSNSRQRIEQPQPKPINTEQQDKDLATKEKDDQVMSALTDLTDLVGGLGKQMGEIGKRVEDLEKKPNKDVNSKKESVKKDKPKS